MTLDEIFNKYPNDKSGFFRKSRLDNLRNSTDTDLTDKQLASYLPKYSVRWLKGLKSWGNEDSRKLGFAIPDGMIDDASADDWEIYED